MRPSPQSSPCQGEADALAPGEGDIRDTKRRNNQRYLESVLQWWNVHLNIYYACCRLLAWKGKWNCRKSSRSYTSGASIRLVSLRRWIRNSLGRDLAPKRSACGSAPTDDQIDCSN